MKFLQLFTKIPNYKRFGYVPRHFDPKEEARKERELRLKRESMPQEEEEKLSEEDNFGYRRRIIQSIKKNRDADS
jgi:hypothetical protein